MFKHFQSEPTILSSNEDQYKTDGGVFSSGSLHWNIKLRSRQEIYNFGSFHTSSVNPTENLAKSKTASKHKFEVQVLYCKTVSFVLVLIRAHKF